MKSHVLIIADGRSPTAQSWIKNIQSLDYKVSLISTFNCQPLPNLIDFHVLPIAFSRFGSRQGATTSSGPQTGFRAMRKRFSPLFQALRYLLGPLSLPWYVRKYKTLVDQIQPDLVHALRIPFEGMLGSYTPDGYPFLVATWGNDLTLHAQGSWLMRYFTRRCLKRADGMTSDTHRDIRLAKAWGLDPVLPTLVLPGSGGLELEKIKTAEVFNGEEYPIPKGVPWVINPRGIRPSSVHQDTFFSAIPIVLEKQPKVCFICPGLKGVVQAEKWVSDFRIKENIFLLPKLSQTQLWSLFKASDVFVSPSSHDGTPNTLLESMACGCFPVVGNIESMQEWIEDGKNGSLVDPLNPEELGEAILKALTDENLRSNAAQHNLTLLAHRADKRTTLPIIDQFYSKFIAK